jgi:hypothetical protein
LLTLNNCLSQDASSQSWLGAGNLIGASPTNEFLSLAPVNLHLRGGAVAIDAGKSLSTQFSDDIDGYPRPQGAAWDIGGDESFASGATTYHRSIGTAPDLANSGTITVTAGSATVTKVGGLGWQAENRGRGDVLIVNGSDQYMILAVVSDNELTLASLATTSYSGGTYTIARQYADFDSWWDCVANNVVCSYFPVSSASLSADDRREAAIAYRDPPTFSFQLGGSDINLQGTTTDASHDIVITADPGNRHNGIPSAAGGSGVVLDAQGPAEFIIRDSYVTVEWLEFVGCKGADNLSAIEVWGGDGPPVDVATNVVLQNLLIHDFNDTTAGFNNSGIDLTGSNTVAGKSVTIRNTMIWDGDQRGIEGDEPLDVALIENVTVDGMVQNGIWADQSTFTVNNTIVTRSGVDYSNGSGTMSGSNNTSSDGTAFTQFGEPPLHNNVLASDLYVESNGPNWNLHLVGTAVAVDSGMVPTSSFASDIDGELRPAGAAWDRGADEFGATTAVELVSFEAVGSDSAVELSWRTGSELSNLGFHLHRSLSEGGPCGLVSRGRFVLLPRHRAHEPGALLLPSRGHRRLLGLHLPRPRLGRPGGLGGRGRGPG